MHRWHLCLAGALLACLVASVACSRAGSPQDRIHRMGERVEVGTLTYNIFEDHWRAQLGQGTDARLPKDRFFLVRFNVVNSGSSDSIVPTMTLVDDSGNTYDELSNGDQVPSWAGFLRRVKPAETLHGNVVFDVPPKHYKIRLGDENGQTTSDVDIPLNFQSDSPEMPPQQP